MCKYEPDIDPTYHDLAEHYSTAVILENRKIEKPKVNPLPIQEVDSFLECVVLFYRPFFVVAFFTRMRAGEMSALKWKNVDFDRRIIKVVETRVYGEEGRPKTNSSYRDIDMLPMVYDALKEQRLRTNISRIFPI